MMRRLPREFAPTSTMTVDTTTLEDFGGVSETAGGDEEGQTVRGLRLGNSMAVRTSNVDV